MDALEQQVQVLRQAINSSNPNLQQCKQSIITLKKTLLRLGVFGNTTKSNRVDIKLLLQAREIYELACIVSLKAKNIQEFVHHYKLVRPLYRTINNNSSKDIQPDSDRRMGITYLYLLYLLSSIPAQLAEFHAEIETLQPNELTNHYIEAAISIERCLEEGSFTSVVKRTALPLPELAEVFIVRLANSAREAFANSIQVSYESIPYSSLQSLLLATEEQVQDIIKDRGWIISSDKKTVNFPPIERPSSINLSSTNDMDLNRYTLSRLLQFVVLMDEAL